MSEPNATHDPELIGLLAEVAADPNAMLMKIATGGTRPGAGIYDRPISVGESFLTKAERRMLERHREELAALLADGCRVVMREQPFLQSKIHWTRGPLDRNEWRTRINLTTKGSAEFQLSWNELLGRIATKQVLRNDASRFCEASLRLLPSESARNLLILALNYEGKADRARVHGEACLSATVSKSEKALYQSNCGFVAAGAGRKLAALCSFSEAARLAPNRPQFACNWFILELWRGDVEAIERSGRFLCDVVDECSATFQDCVSVLKQDVRQGTWDPTPDSRRTVPRVRERLSGPAGALANVVS